MVITLMMSAEMTTAGFLKITTVFSNKGYDVIILSMASPTKFYHVIKF